MSSIILENQNIILSYCPDTYIHTCTQPWLHTPNGEEIVESVLPTLNWKACLNQLPVCLFFFALTRMVFTNEDFSGRYGRSRCGRSESISATERIFCFFGNNCSNDVYTVSSDRWIFEKETIRQIHRRNKSTRYRENNRSETSHNHKKNRRLYHIRRRKS